MRGSLYLTPHHLPLGVQERPIDEDYKTDLMAAYERCGLMGERVIGFAYKVIDARDPESYKNCEGTDREPPKDDLVFLGLVSLVDPPRPGVPEAVQKCRSAGITVVMVWVPDENASPQIYKSWLNICWA